MNRARRRRWISLGFALWLGACSAADFDLGPAGTDPSLYAKFFPYFVESCAVSDMKKKPDFGFEYRGHAGGHAVFWLNGACLDRDAHYPVLQLCTEPAGGQPGPEDGVGISANAHYRNANWAAIPGRSFFFSGGLAPGARLTQDAYRNTQEEAKRLGILDGVTFYDEVFDDMKPGWTREDWRYEVSIGTDYAIDFARGRYCERVPVSREQMHAITIYLNDRNDIYRTGQKDFHWDVLRDNCSHLVHNALAVAGVWPFWPTNRSLIVSAFDFPVPRNEFVNLARRTNDLPIDDPHRLFSDPTARMELERWHRLPAEPGALAQSVPPRQPNDVYDSDLELIFYDEPVFGLYAPHFRQIFTEPRYTDLGANLRHFAMLYAQAPAPGRPQEAAFNTEYASYLATQRTLMTEMLARYSAATVRSSAGLASGTW